MSNEPQDFDDMVFHNMVGWRDRSNRMEIERDALRAENARLREALGRAYEAVETCDETYPGSKYLNVELKAIRAALAGEVKL